MLNLVTVTQVSAMIRELVQSSPYLVNIWVSGEVSNFRLSPAGHAYLTLRDADDQIACVQFRSRMRRASYLPIDGEAVLAHGSVGIYTARSQYQLIIDMIQPAGSGELKMRFEMLKAQLGLEGLFEENRKRSLPAFPRLIGIATSPTGAALQDALKVLDQRYPLANVVVSPCLVQGVEAPSQIRDALERLNDLTPRPDVILLVRGGGSTEDLDCFNDESVARAIFGSRIPVVSGVGHEIDTTIADLVADSRAPTPSVAAEMVTPDASDLHMSVANLRGSIEHYFAETLNEDRTALRDLLHRLQLQAPSRQVEMLRQRIDELADRAGRAIVHVLSGERQQMSTIIDRLNTLNPSSVLERGYSYCRNETTGQFVRRADQVSAGDDLAVRFSVGQVKARAEKVMVTNE